MVRSRPALRDPDRVSELVRPVSASVDLAIHPTQHIVILKRAQQLVVAGAWFVRARHNRIHAAEHARADRCAVSRVPRQDERCRRRATHVPAPARPLCRWRSPGRRDPLHASINAAVEIGMSYGSSSGSSRSSSASPVEEMPAACVRVANSAPRARSEPITAQSRMNPAEGASNATGRPAICVHVSQIASGSGT